MSSDDFADWGGYDDTRVPAGITTYKRSTALNWPANPGLLPYIRCTACVGGVVKVPHGWQACGTCGGAGVLGGAP